MERLWLDYERADPGRHSTGLAVLAVGAVAALLVSGDYLAVAAERDEAQARVEELRAAASRQVAAAPPTAGTPAAAAKPVAPSAARWESLFGSLEAAADDSVTLLALRPTDKEIQISGEAKDFPASVDYVQRLEAQPALANVHLTQSETLADNPHHPVRFSLVADWRSAR